MKIKVRKKLKYIYNKLKIFSPDLLLKLKSIYQQKYYENDYFFKTHKVNNVLDKQSGYQTLVLVGDNWLEKEKYKDIAIIFGTEEWQYGFISSYLVEYRVAFIPNRMISPQIFYTLLNLKIRPSVLITWEYNRFNTLKFCAKKMSLPALRLSNAFLNSINNDKMTPYSLLLNKTDSKTFFTDYTPIENILNNINYTHNKELVENVQSAFCLVKDLSILKEEIEKRISLKKKVLILGQSKTNFVLKVENPQNFTQKQLKQLVEDENPDAEIIYALDKDPIMFSSIDHIYTISSPLAIDALLRGIKVTLLGTPIYGGWGLTDDRVRFKNRKRKLTLIELFYGLYLKYPRYLANVNNSSIGIHAACLRLASEQEIYQHDININNNILDLAKSSFWPKIFFTNVRKITQTQELLIVKTINFDSLLNHDSGQMFQITLLYSMFGILKNDNSRNIFITKVRKYINYDIFNIFLLDIYQLNNDHYILNHFIWYLSETNQSEFIKQLPLGDTQKKENKDENNVCSDDKIILFNLLEEHKKNKNFSEALIVAKKLMLSGYTTTILFVRLAELAELTLDIISARNIAKLLQKTNLNAHNRAGIHLEIENSSFDKSSEAKQQLKISYAKQLKLNPDRINRSWAILKTYFNERDYEIFKGMLNLDNSQVFQKALSYLEIDDLNRARGVIEHLIEQGEATDKIHVVYAKILFAVGEYDKARKIVEQAIAITPTHENFTEILRQLKSLAKFKEAFEFVKDAKSKKIKLTKEGHIMPIYFGLGDIEEGFKCFLESSLQDKLLKYFGKTKYLDTIGLKKFKNIRNLLIIFSSGPAEEMRFASIYEEVQSEFGSKNFRMTCDYRLENLLKRSFPKIEFIPVRRTRFFTSEYRREEYDKLPGSDLCNALDNKGIEAVEDADKIVLLTDLIHRYRKNYNSFPGTPYLKVDDSKVKAYKKHLNSDIRYIGLSWRSSLTNSMRNVHYLKIEQLEPLFQIPNVVYVNFQYDECSAELEWVDQKYPGKLINFEDIDQFNDFDSVAALMMCMDVIISPVTAVIDLAGSIGCKGLLFGYHGELQWRRIDDNNRDVWFHHVKHVKASYGDDNQLVENIVSIIEHHKY